MVKVTVKKINDTYPEGMLECFEKTTNERIKINLSTLAEDGVMIHDDGKIDIGGARPSIDYFTSNPPRTDEVFINATGWFHVFYELVISRFDGYILIQCIPIQG